MTTRKWPKWLAGPYEGPGSKWWGVRQLNGWVSRNPALALLLVFVVALMSAELLMGREFIIDSANKIIRRWYLERWFR